jgi:hypothetical protein
MTAYAQDTNRQTPADLHNLVFKRDYRIVPAITASRNL